MDISISKATIARMGIYLRCLSYFEESGVETISSKELADQIGVTPEQVRRDLSFFGRFGKTGAGYNVSHLMKEIEAIFGKDKRVLSVAVIGVGSLGTAILKNPHLSKWGFKFKVAFDIDKNKIGKRIGRVPIYDIKDLHKIIMNENISLGIITVPVKEAKTVAQKLVESGIKGILNFVPIRIKVPKEVSIVSLDISQYILELAFYILDKEHKQEKMEEEIKARAHEE